MSYAYADGIVWVDDLDPEPHPMTHDLCDDHASSITPPRGWELRDRRHRSVVGTLPFERSASVA